MKVLAVVGSLRKGNTAKMVQAACSCFTTDEIRIIDLSQISLRFCTGCLYCDSEKKCCIEDDMTSYMESIASADAFIFASPVRWSLLSGEMKTFFDRLNPFATTGVLYGKKAVLFVVGQSAIDSDDAYSIDAGLESMKFFCENAGIDVVDTVKAFGCLSETDIESTKYLDMCCSAANNLKAVLQ